MVSRLWKKMYVMSCVWFGLQYHLFAGGKDIAEAIHLEAKTQRNKDGATINYG